MTTRKEFEAAVMKKYVASPEPAPVSAPNKCFIYLAIACAADVAAEHGLKFEPELPERLDFVQQLLTEIQDGKGGALRTGAHPVIVREGVNGYLTPDQARAVCDVWRDWGPEGELRKRLADILSGFQRVGWAYMDIVNMESLLAAPWAVKP